jgi:hypothetical protein
VNTEETQTHIRNACIAGLLSASVTTLFAFGGFVGYSRWEVVDAGLVLGLTFGIWRFSRVCAVFMLAYFLFAKVMNWMDVGIPGVLGLVIAFLFAYLYFQAVRATFSHHRAKRGISD